eukprot:jgi/Mesen1/4594/ME000232S03848
MTSPVATCHCRDSFLQAVPSETAQLARFQDIADLTVDFEASLREEDFIPQALPLEPEPGALPGGESASGAAGGPTQAPHAAAGRLSSFAADVDIHFALKRRSRVLTRARNIFAHSDFPSIQVGPGIDLQLSKDDAYRDAQPLPRAFSEGGGGAGLAAPAGSGSFAVDSSEPAFFEVEACHISGAARELLALVHEAMQEVKTDVPLQAGSGPTTGASGGWDWEVFRAQSVGVPCVAFTTARELYSAARDALSLYRAIVPVKRVFEGSLGWLMDAVLARSAASVLAIDDISVDETLHIRHLLDELLFQLPRILFPSPGESGPSPAHRLKEAEEAQEDEEEDEETEKNGGREQGGGGGRGPGGAAAGGEGLTAEVAAAPHASSTRDLREVVPSAMKLHRLLDLLDMSLVAIVQAWESGDLLSCGFTRDEVMALIRAVFTDTPLRRDSLRVVSST